MPTPQSDRQTFREAFDDWYQPRMAEEYGSEHAVAIDWCFRPPESYDDPWLERIFELYEFVLASPCVCTRP